MKKRFIAFVLVFALVVGSSLSVSADWIIQPYYPTSQSDLYMNIAGQFGSSLNMRYITLYRVSSATALNSDQKFTLMRTLNSTDSPFVLCASANTRYAINRNGSTGRAWMWDLTADGIYDSALERPRSDPGQVLVPLNYNYIGYVDRNVYFDRGTRDWDVGGTPTLPLSPSLSEVQVNPFI